VNRGTNLSILYSNFPSVKRSLDHCIFTFVKQPNSYLDNEKFKLFLMVLQGILKHFLYVYIYIYICQEMFLGFLISTVLITFGVLHGL
jgi:hypothetical protein